MEAQPQGPLVPGAVLLLHHVRPDAPRRAELGDLLEEVYVRVEEEREAWGEVVDVEASLDAGLHVSEAICKGKGELLCSGAPGLTDMVAGDRDGVPLGHVLEIGRAHV